MNKNNFKEKSYHILKGFEKAYEKMVQFKKEKGTPLVVSVDGSVKHIPVNEIPLTAMYNR